MRNGGFAFGCGLVLLVAACGEAAHSSADGAGGAGGSVANAGGTAGRVGSTGRGAAGRTIASTGGSSSNETGESGAPSVAGTAPVACEVGPAVPLLRPGCPLNEPHASDCADEGLRCLYADETPECFAEWECLLGLWSPRGTRCHVVSEPDPTNLVGCTSYVPVDGEPCDTADVECRYGPCGSFGYRREHVTCVCARFRADDAGCPTVP